MPASVTPAAPTLQQPGVVGDDLDHLHLVLGQDDVKAQQEEGDVLVDAGADDVEHRDDQNHQQQRHLETHRVYTSGSRLNCVSSHGVL